MSTRYRWWGWAAETDLDNDDDREGVYYLTIGDDEDELAIIVHRTVGGKYPLDGDVANSKVVRAQRIVDALNATDESPAPEVIVMRVFDEDDWSYDVVVCPREGCLSTEFYEVDVATRWNPMDLNEDKQSDTRAQYVRALNRHGGVVGVEGGQSSWVTVPNPLADMPMFVVSQGSDGDGFETDHHICQVCTGRVTLPEWLDTEWIA